MVGYPESLTDPSYMGQILALTFPLIGNYGMPDESLTGKLKKYYESGSGKVSGLIVDDYSGQYQHWNAGISLAQWLYNQRIPAIGGIDTRMLTKHLREKGTMLGKIIIQDKDISFYNPDEHNLTRLVSSGKPELYGSGEKRVVLLDCGAKSNIIRELIKRDIEVLRVPWDFPLENEPFDGLLISNGPGNPKLYQSVIREIRSVLEKDVPVFGICLGHQLMSLAAGADTYKMKYGHRGQNQPVINPGNKHCYITSQNHGFAVDTDTLPESWSPLYVNLNDGTNEGLIHESGRFFSVQFHPEASPGPVDTTFLFDQFTGLL